MNTLEIDNILYSDKHCGRVFKGSHAIDALPQFEPGVMWLILHHLITPGFIGWLCLVSQVGMTSSTLIPRVNVLHRNWCNGGNLISFKIRIHFKALTLMSAVSIRYIIWHTGVGDVTWETFCPRSPLTLTTMIWLFTNLLTVIFVSYSNKTAPFLCGLLFHIRLRTWSIW